MLSPGSNTSEAGSSASTEPGGAAPRPESPARSLPVIRTAREARRPGSRASTLASPGLTPTTVPSGPTLAMRVSELQKANLAD